jgi:HEPN domain-containing protein
LFFNADNLNLNLNYLPELKREELTEITEVIIAEMKPAMVILFGSYARNTWAEEITHEDGIKLLFKSDYDILVVTSRDLNATANKQWIKIQQILKSRKYSTSLSLIQHSVGYINNELSAGGYFFTDVIKEGKVLYDSGEVKLGKPGNVDPVEVKKRAKEEFERWTQSGNEFLEVFNYSFDKELYNKAAFLLHQATESFYTAYLLVFTGYKGKSHDIEELGNQVAKLHPEFKTVFPIDNKLGNEAFFKLKRAYVDARYKKDYSITKEELKYLSGRVEVLKALAEKVCGEKIRS